MKKTNVTFSIPEETNQLLHAVVGQRKMSSFVTRVINEALAKEVADLKAAYAFAEKDPARKETVQDWSALDGEEWE